MWFSSSFPQSSPLSLCKHSSQSLTKIPAARDAAGCSAATPSILPFHVKSITSTSNPFVKHCVKLRNSTSYRHSHGSVLLVGTTPIREMFNFQESKGEKASRIDCLLLHENAEVPEDLVESGIRIVRVSSVVMKKLCGVQSTESIDAVSLVKIPSTFHNLDDDHHQGSSKWFPSAF
ncbi:putative 50S ribosomal protein L30e [Helianthus annuus]|nr:putative 50S ribosomal protein L30e [Helianthus annuus]